MNETLPKSPYLRDLFIKHFIAKAFRWTPDVLERITADELDVLVYIESEKNKKEIKDRDNELKNARRNY